jgi:hypothetical protein
VELVAVCRTAIALDESRARLHGLDLIDRNRSVIREANRVQAARRAVERRVDVTVVDADQPDGGDRG